MSEVVFGGVGTGLYSMLVFVLLAVFIGGLMVGRTPEYLGKKIGAARDQARHAGALFTPLTVLLDQRDRDRRARRQGGRSPPRARRASLENLYAYLSQANNNGSAWAGYTGYIQPNAGNLGAHGVTFVDLLGGLTMVFARFAPIIARAGHRRRAGSQEGRAGRARDDAHRHARRSSCC